MKTNLRIITIFVLSIATSFLLPSLGDELDQRSSTTDLKEPSLSTRIDAMLAKDHRTFSAAPASDGELLRRMSLDLRGVVPTLEELDAYVADKSPYRWSDWVRRFLNDPLCNENLVAFFDRTLMLRRPHSQVDRATWLGFLRERVAADKPLDELSKELLYSDWWNRDHRASQKFFLDRAGDPHLIARDLGRVFLGRDFQCAQCHDHPHVEDYEQLDYHGLLAFVASSKLHEAPYKDAEGKDQKVQLYVELASSDASFESVFFKGTPYRSGPRLPNRKEQFEDYLLPDGRTLLSPPTDALAGVPIPPQHSRRRELSNQLADRSNRQFVSNWANRMWARVFGRGLVEPVDLQHPDNPPSNIELYELIAEGLLEVEMRPRRFIEQLVLTHAYRRGDLLSLTVNGNHVDPMQIQGEQSSILRDTLKKRLTGTNEQVERLKGIEINKLKDYETARENWQQVQAGRVSIRTELDTAEAAMLDAKRKSTEATAALAAAEKRQRDTQSRIALLDESADKLRQAMELAGGEDSELKQAIAVAKQRAEAARAMIPEIEKSIVEKKTAFDATVPVLDQATSKVRETVAKLEPVHEALRNADAAFTAARKDWGDQRTALNNLLQQVACDEHLVAFLNASETLLLVRSTIDQTPREIAKLEVNLASNNRRMELSRRELSIAEESRRAMANKLEAANDLWKHHSSEIAQLRRSIASLDEATKLIQQPEPLLGALQSIQNEIESRETRSGQLQSNVAEVGQALSESVGVVAKIQESVASNQSDIEQIQNSLASRRELVFTDRLKLDQAKLDVEQKWTTVRADSEKRFAVFEMRPLSPEQLCWSTLRITGQLETHIQAEVAALDKQSPLPTDSVEYVKSMRRRQAFRLAVDKLHGQEDTFVSLYASGPDKTQDEFFASADQALHMSNAGSVFQWAGPSSSNVTQQAMALKEDQEIANLIYRTLLCRTPSTEERKLVSEQLTTPGDAKNAIIQEMVWGILASSEFRFYRY